MMLGLIFILIFSISVAVTKAADCPPGWTTFGSYCYEAFDLFYETWYQAEQKCAEAWPNGHLAWIDSSTENAFLVNLTKSLPYSYSLWIGLEKPCPNPSEPWHWSALQNLTFQNFALFPPPTTDTCGSFDGPQSSVPGQWNTAGCGTYKYGSICKAPKNGTKPPSPVNFQPGCPLKWCRLGSFCYKAFSTRLFWQEAETECNIQGGNLVSVHSDQENNFTRLVADVVTNAGSQFWIGLTMLNGYDGQFRWSDGTPSDYIQWAPTQPDNNNYYMTESCVETFSDMEWLRPSWRGQWNDNRCDEGRPYVCKQYAQGYTPSPVTVPPKLNGGCPVGGWQPFYGRCYKYFNSPMNFTAANKICRDQSPRSFLVSVRNVYEQSFLTSMMKLNQKNTWIGIFFANQEARWIDESQLIYTNWYKTFEPDDQCAYIRGAMLSGQWTSANSSTCNGDSMKLPYVCSQPQNPTLPTASPTPNTCPNRFLSYSGDACYYFNSALSTWQDGQTSCRSFGSISSLATIADQLELAYIVATAKTAGISSFWIGLNDIQTPSTFSWIDGWPVFLTEWGPGQPEINSQKQCVFMSINNTQRGSNWYTDSCSNVHPSLCKYSAAPPPTVLINGTCPNGWIEGSTKCFSIFKNTTAAFAEAHFKCEQLGSNLASFQSAGDIELLALQQSVHLSKLMFYIGLFQTYNGYTWTDGSDANYFNWANGEPSKPAPSQNTAAAMDNISKWHNVEYHTPLYFICELPKQALQSTAFATTGSRSPMKTTTTRPCSGNVTMWLQVFLEFFDDTAGGGLLYGGSHCDRFWFTGVDQCDMAIKLCLEPSQMLPSLATCSTGWIDLGQITTDYNNATFVPGKRYGGWSNPTQYSFNHSNGGYQMKYIVQDVDNGGRQLIDQNVCQFKISSSGVLSCVHMRNSGNPANFQFAYATWSVC